MYKTCSSRRINRTYPANINRARKILALVSREQVRLARSTLNYTRVVARAETFAQISR